MNNEQLREMCVSDFIKTEEGDFEGTNLVWGRGSDIRIKFLPDNEKTLSVLPEKYLNIINEKLKWINENKSHDTFVKKVNQRIDRIGTIIGNNYHLCGIDCGICGKYDEDNGTFEGKTFCLTGTLKDYTREEAKEIIEGEAEGIVVDTLSEKVDYLIAGKKAGSKIEKAKAMGIPILDEEAFGEIANGMGPPFVLEGKRPHFNVNYEIDVYIRILDIYPLIDYAKIYFANDSEDCHYNYELDTVMQLDNNNVIRLVGENYDCEDDNPVNSWTELFTKLTDKGSSEAKEYLKERKR